LSHSWCHVSSPHLRSAADTPHLQRVHRDGEVPVQTLIEEGFTPEEAKTIKIQKGKAVACATAQDYKAAAAYTKSWKSMTKSGNSCWLERRPWN